MKKIDLTKFETVLYCPSREDGSETVIVDNGVDEVEECSRKGLDIKLSELELQKFVIKRRFGLIPEIYILKPKRGLAKSNGSQVRIGKKSYPRVFYSPFYDSLFDESFTKLGSLRYLETDGIRVREVRDDMRKLNFKKGRLYEITAA
ncbi:MAG: hypothetical protein ABIJ20_03855 [Nanoarchaeota archaeon]|nr:hypothetical protein [Nanoarchaeota archaeon]MBU1445512.1 hypothetical protein [Nanoarchaeota archaeon]MBU2406997.1 hypothetical protein [Nanoarchaeota archaeon]MBU2420611.1 hypothetical protein [Nanoarchaeota archaeon]MBU2474941.1 hypothetical protein [Nanoarchaeota archaeon]